MKKPATPLKQCLVSVQAATDALEQSGAKNDDIVSALVHVLITTAQKDRRPAETLDAAAQVIMTAAEYSFQQDKKDRAAKRRKSETS